MPCRGSARDIVPDGMLEEAEVAARREKMMVENREGFQTWIRVGND